LVDAHYSQDYHIWKWRLDANIRANHYLVDHLRDPSGTVAYCQSIEAPVSIQATKLLFLLKDVV
jgi:hypothetical protein